MYICEKPESAQTYAHIKSPATWLPTRHVLFSQKVDYKKLFFFVKKRDAFSAGPNGETADYGVLRFLV